MNEEPANTLVEVMTTPDPVAMAIAKSLLEGADIPYFTAGESIQHLIGLGGIGGANILTGPMSLRVPHDRAEEALEVLSQLDDDEEE